MPKKKTTVKTEEQLMQEVAKLEERIAELDEAEQYANPQEGYKIMREIAKLRNERTELLKKLGITEGFDENPFNKSAGEHPNRSTGPFTQITRTHNKVKAVNEGKKVFTPEYHNAMLRVVDIGGA